jgi:hypothetical protein
MPAVTGETPTASLRQRGGGAVSVIGACPFCARIEGSDVSHGVVTDFDDDGRRRHGLWGLAVLVMIAVIVVSFMILFTGGHTNGSSGPGQDDSTLSGALPSGSARSSNAAGPAPRSSSVSTGSSSAPPCAAGAACPLSGQIASIAAGINNLRINQGLRPVPASGSSAAQQCAVTQGSGPTCVPHFMYAGVADANPDDAVKALQNVNESWLLDPTVTRLEIGWVRGAGRYNCAVLKFP